MTKSRSLLSYSLGVGHTTARLRLPPDTCESQSADVSSTLQKRLKVHLTDFRYAFPGVAGGGGDGGGDGGGGEGGGEGGGGGGGGEGGGGEGGGGDGGGGLGGG